MNQLINFIVFFFFLYKYEISSISINNKFISVPRKSIPWKGGPYPGPEPEAYEPNEGFQDVPRMMYGHLTTRLTPPSEGWFLQGLPWKVTPFLNNPPPSPHNGI